MHHPGGTWGLDGLREREEKHTWYTKIPRSEATAKKQMNHRTTSPAMIEPSNFQPVKLRIQLQLSLSLSLSLSLNSPLPGLTASLFRICLLSEFHTMHATNDRRALSLSLSLFVSIVSTNCVGFRLFAQIRVRLDYKQVHLDKLDWEGASKWDNQPPWLH
jgi:hypothetical protein